MDFLSDYFYIIILIVGAVAQWLKSRSEAAQEKGYTREEADYDPAELEEFENEAERRHSQPAVPPPLPGGGALPGVGRSPVPELGRKNPPPQAAILGASEELARQQALIDQAKEFKRAKVTRKSKEVMPHGKLPVPVASGLRGRLHSRPGLRSAFVLKEILEKPMGLR